MIFFFTYFPQRQVPSNLECSSTIWISCMQPLLSIEEHCGDGPDSSRGRVWLVIFTVLYISETYFTDIPNLHRWTTQEKSKKGKNDYRPKGLQTKSHRNLLLHVLELWILPTTLKKKIFWQVDFKIGQWY